MHAADATGHGEPRPSAAALVGVLHDARRPLIGQSTGGLSTAQMRMVLSAFEIAGRQFVPSADQLRTTPNCSGGCGNAAALDSLLSSAVRALEDDVSRSAPNAADAASVFVQRYLQWHACNGGCASGLRADTMRHPRLRPLNATAEAQTGRSELPPADSPARPLPDRTAPVPAAQIAPSHTNSRRAPLRGSMALARGLPAPSHGPLDVPRLADPFAPGPVRLVAPNSSGEVVREGRPRFSAQQRGHADVVDDDDMNIATESAGRHRSQRQWHATAAEVGACLQRPPPPGVHYQPPFLFPSLAPRRLELFPVDRISLAEGNALSRRVVDGFFLWFLTKFGRDGGYGGLRVLISVTADDMAASVARDHRLVGRVRHAIVERLVFSAGTTVVPVCTGGTWWAIVVTGVRDTDVRVVAAVRSGAALSDEAVREAALAVIDTSSVEKGEGEWDEHVVTGLFRALTVAICATYLRTCDDSRKTTLF